MSSKNRKQLLRKKDSYKSRIVQLRGTSVSITNPELHEMAVFSTEDNFYKFRSLKDIGRLKVEGDVYKGVMIEGETRIVARITGQVFSFPVAICSSDADQKIKNAYTELNRQIAERE